MKEDYPVTIYAYAILLDNKIENWSVSRKNRSIVGQFSGFWKLDRLKDYRLQKTCWICRNPEEINKVFEELAPKWFKSWKHADGYSLCKAY